MEDVARMNGEPPYRGAGGIQEGVDPSDLATDPSRTVGRSEWAEMARQLSGTHAVAATTTPPHEFKMSAEARLSLGGPAAFFGK